MRLSSGLSVTYSSTLAQKPFAAARLVQLLSTHMSAQSVLAIRYGLAINSTFLPSMPCLTGPAAGE